MNPLISPTSSLFLPLCQLNPHCDRLLNSITNDRISQKERLIFETSLWNEVKKIRSLNDSSIFLYLIGYYHNILHYTRLPYTHNDLFQYHVLIRLGDLNRYLGRADVAEYYYCNARNLFPHFGHAYNQLGLLTNPKNCYKCCYYYVRAARSSEKPLSTIADSNLRIAITKYSCDILNHVLNHDSDIEVASLEDDLKRLPRTAFEWFYVIVVAIYADNIKPITKFFLRYMNENFSTQKSTTIHNNVKTTTVYCDRESYILLACLDILMDWLKHGTQGKSILSFVGQELRQIKSSLRAILASFDNEKTKCSANYSDSTSSSTTITSSNSTRMSTDAPKSNPNLIDSTFVSASESSSKSSHSVKLPALPHDYILRGFSPLDTIHNELIFNPRARGRENSDVNPPFVEKYSCQRFVDTWQLVQILCRIKFKMEAFGPLIRRQTRNIALESILYNMEKNHESIN